MKRSDLLVWMALATLTVTCKNRDVNEGEQFKPREIHEDVSFHFDSITVDGIEYLILEKDNNNPHEGFGFMALRGNRLIQKQDTILAYLRTVTDLQVEILAGIYDRPTTEITQRVDEILHRYIDAQKAELMQLESATYQNFKDSTGVSYLPK